MSNKHEKIDIYSFSEIKGKETVKKDKNTEDKNGKKGKKKFRGFIKKHKIISVIIAIVLVLLIIFGILFIKVKQNSGSTYSYIRTTTLSKGDLDNSISATGTVESAEVSNVTTSLSYTVKSIAVAVGDKVKTGDIICTLDTEELEEQIEKERSNIEKQISSAEQSYNSAKTSFENANEKLDSSKSELDTAKAELNIAKTPYNNAKSAVKSNQNEYDKALTNYNKAGSAFVAAQNNYNKALSSGDNSKIISAAKTYMTAVQNLYGKCSVGTVDISDSSSSVLVSQNSQNSSVQANANQSQMSNSGSNISSNSSSSSSSVTVSKTADDICKEVINKVNSLTGKTLSIPSGTNTLYKLGLKAQSLSAAKSAANYSSLESAYNFALSEYESAKQNYNQYKESAEQAQNQLEQAQSQLDEASTSDTLEELESQFSDCYIKANQDGTVTSLNATVGSSVSGGSSGGIGGTAGSSAIATISNLDKLKVSITISEADINNAKIGMSCYITSDASDETLNGTLTQLDPIASETGSFGAEVTVDSEENSLLVGMNASVEIIVSSTEGVFSVPKDAIGNDDDGKGDYVYRKTGGEGTDMTFEKIYVTLGEENDYYIEIQSDELAQGDVIRSSSDLSEGIEEVQSDNSNSGSIFSLFGGGNMPGADRGAMRQKGASQGSGNSSFSGSNMPNGNMPSPPNGGQ
ncbi:MAG: efflux RND transporter periplasmic adaptor subunit [Acutalibacteraceae bacterium]|nr:efflux RND transporter periplasmic adaptor subunit [Acutalibacteraceae bacterium]